MAELIFSTRQPPGYAEYLNSPEWAAKRAQRLSHDKNRCQHCGRGGPLEVHHLTYRRFGNERLTDLISLCPDCHPEADEERRSRAKRFRRLSCGRR